MALTGAPKTVYTAYMDNKQYRYGEVNPETGLVFVRRDARYRNGEYWVTTEKFERRKERLRAQSQKVRARPPAETPFRQGQVHPETGLVFFSRCKSCKGGLRWVTPEKYAEYEARRIERLRSVALPETTFKRGDIHPETGLVFWTRNKSCKGGIWWVTPEKFKVFLARVRERYRELETPAEVAYKYGDIHPTTGLICMGRQRGAKDGVRWITPEKYAEKNARMREWKKKPESLSKARAYENRLYETDRVFAVKKRLRSRLLSAIRQKTGVKTMRTLNVIGCTWEELVAHIEKRFRPGMSWDNRSEWHIDHIVPLASAKTEDDLIRLSHYTNLQPLWAAENQKKSDTIPTPC